jgi:hypothetical protein
MGEKHWSSLHADCGVYYRSLISACRESITSLNSVEKSDDETRNRVRTTPSRTYVYEVDLVCSWHPAPDTQVQPWLVE